MVLPVIYKSLTHSSINLELESNSNPNHIVAGWVFRPRLKEKKCWLRGEKGGGETDSIYLSLVQLLFRGKARKRWESVRGPRTRKGAVLR